MDGVLKNPQGMKILIGGIHKFTVDRHDNEEHWSQFSRICLCNYTSYEFMILTLLTYQVGLKKV